MTPIIVGAVSAVLALVAALGVGYKLGRNVCEDQVVELRQSLDAGLAAQAAARSEVTTAQKRIDELAAQLRTAVDSPQIVYLEKEVRSYEPPAPLPAGACADARWTRMFNSLSGSGPSRTPASAARAARATESASAAAADTDGYVSALAFRQWAADAARQYRAAVKRDHDWCQFVQTIPGIEPFPCTEGGK